MTRATSPAARRRAMRSTGGLAAGEHEVQARRQVQDERLEELVQRVAVGGVGVVDDQRQVTRRRPARRSRRRSRRGRRPGPGCPASRARSVPAARRRRRTAARQLVDELARQRERCPAGRRAADLDARDGGGDRPQQRRLAPPGGCDHERQPVLENEGRPAPPSERRPTGRRASARTLRQLAMTRSVRGRRERGGTE